MSLFKPTERNHELDDLLEKARIAVQAMSPEERSSMYACQAIGYVMSELVMSVHEDGASRDGTRSLLRRMIDAIDGDASVYTEIPSVAEKVWRLLPDDKIRMRARISNALSELDV